MALHETEVTNTALAYAFVLTNPAVGNTMDNDIMPQIAIFKYFQHFLNPI